MSNAVAADRLALVAGKEYPVVRQFSNTCGLASMSMVFLHHLPDVEKFLIELHAKATAGRRGHEQGRVARDTAMIWASGYLLLKARASVRLANWLKRIGSEFEYEDFVIALEMVLHQRGRRRVAGLDTAMKYYKKRIIRTSLMSHYLVQFKTQHELKMLAFMFGLEPVPYPRETMGTLYFHRNDPRLAEKVAFIKEQFSKPDRAMLVGQGQSHWMVPHALFESSGETPVHVLGVNDPLGSRTRLNVERLDNAHVFYFFKCDAARNTNRLAFLRDVLHL